MADTSSTRRTIYSYPSDASGGVLTSLIINLPETAGLGWLTLGISEGDAHTQTHSQCWPSHCLIEQVVKLTRNEPIRPRETKGTQMSNNLQPMKRSSGDWIHPVGNISCGMTVIAALLSEHCL